jgi:hypothetical protein
MQDPDSSSSSVFHAGEIEVEEEICSKEGQSLLMDSARLNFGVSAEELPPSSSLEFEAMASTYTRKSDDGKLTLLRSAVRWGKSSVPFDGWMDGSMDRRADLFRPPLL